MTAGMIAGTVAPMSLDTVWLSYAELAARLGIGGESARNLVRRRGWARKPGNDGVQRVGVPAEYLAERDRESAMTAPSEAPTTPPVIPPVVEDMRGESMGDTISALEAHLETMRTMLDRADARTDVERTRADAERLRADRERDRADALAAELATVRAEDAGQVGDLDRRLAELRQVVDAMRQPVVRPWWRRIAG